MTGGRSGRVLIVALGLAVALPLDGPVHRFTADHLDSPESRLVANGLTALGTFWVGGGLLGTLAVVGQRAGDAALVRTSLGGLAGIVLGGVAGYVVKQATCRARPRTMGTDGASEARSGLASFLARWPCLTQSPFQSFPSGHANTAFALASTLVVAAPAQRRLWLALAGGVAASRLLVNAHFLSDVLAGGLLGWVAGAAGRLWVSRLSAARRRAVDTALRGAAP